VSLVTHIQVQCKEDLCLTSKLWKLTSSTVDSSGAAKGIAIQGGLASAGCQATDHSKATVSSFHMGGALTWAF